MEINLISGGKGGGNILDDGGVYQAAAEHGCTVHRYVVTVRPMLGVRKGSVGAIRDAVVGTGGN